MVPYLITREYLPFTFEFKYNIGRHLKTVFFDNFSIYFPDFLKLQGLFRK